MKTPSLWETACHLSCSLKGLVEQVTARFLAAAQPRDNGPSLPELGLLTMGTEIVTDFRVGMADVLRTMRAKSPLVHCITNYVAMNMAANATLAIGASPAMVHAEEEAGEFAMLADALTINIGTLSFPWLEGMLAAAKVAQQSNKPWVLDPVAHQATAFRRDAIDQLLAHQPTIIRGNASEILALGGSASQARGVDSRDAVEAAEDGAIQLARRYGAVIAVTGPIDFLTDGKRSMRFSGGSPLMPRVTAMGCAQTCVMGAMVGARPEAPFEAAAVALAVFKRAGELAAIEATGPGSFQWRFIDALASPDEHLWPTNLASGS